MIFRECFIEGKRRDDCIRCTPFLFLFFFFPQYNVVKKWLEVEIAPDIRGRIPLLLMSLSFKVGVPEIPGEETLSLTQGLSRAYSVLIRELVWEILC